MSKGNEYITPLKHQVERSSSVTSTSKKEFKSMDDIINPASISSLAISPNVDENHLNSNDKSNNLNINKKYLSENNLNTFKKREREEEIPEVHTSTHKSKENSFLGSKRLTLFLNSNNFNCDYDGENDDDNERCIKRSNNNSNSNSNNGIFNKRGSSNCNSDKNVECITIDDSSSDEIEEIEDEDDLSSGFGTQRIDDDLRSQSQPQLLRNGTNDNGDGHVNNNNNRCDNSDKNDGERCGNERNKLLDRINSFLFESVKRTDKEKR